MHTCTYGAHSEVNIIFGVARALRLTRVNYFNTLIFVNNAYVYNKHYSTE